MGQAGLEDDGKDSGQHQRGTREAAQQRWDRWTQKLEALVVQSNPTVADRSGHWLAAWPRHSYAILCVNPLSSQTGCFPQAWLLSGCTQRGQSTGALAGGHPEGSRPAGAPCPDAPSWTSRPSSCFRIWKQHLLWGWWGFPRLALDSKESETGQRRSMMAPVFVLLAGAVHPRGEGQSRLLRDSRRRGQDQLARRCGYQCFP